jgi:hypothetical protein
VAVRRGGLVTNKKVLTPKGRERKKHVQKKEEGSVDDLERMVFERELKGRDLSVLIVRYVIYLPR